MDYNIALLDHEGFSFTAPERFRNRSRKHVYWCEDTFIYVPKEYNELFNFLALNGLDGQAGGIKVTPFCNVWADMRPYLPDYFAPTMGNILHVLKLLLTWAEAYPDGRWRVTQAEAP